MGKITGYVKSELVVEGTIIEDNKKNQWVVGKLLGQGGFGAIYTGSELSTKLEDKVIKIEPNTNGPLYTEVNFYKRVCEETDIRNWMNEKKLSFLGMPRYISAGLQPNSNNRFLVMDRYGEDLHKILMRTDLSKKCLLSIAINILDVLEYIHSKEYSHADIKALNILQGYKSTKHVYLLDFGMVTKFSNDGTHRPEKIDPKLKHNGTLEFCPRDSHRGLISCRRSDVESLIFNLIFWLSWDRNTPQLSERVGFGKLPWLGLMKGLGNKAPSAALLKQVADSKEKHMADINLFLNEVGLAEQPWSTHLAQLMEQVAAIQYTQKPDYDGLRAQIASIMDAISVEVSVKGGSKKNLDAYRDMSWEVTGLSRKRSRKSQSRSTSARKRSSFGSSIQNSPIVTKPEVKKKRNPTTKKRNPAAPTTKLLKSINNCATEEEQTSSVDTCNIIPKAAFAKRKISEVRTGDESKENDIIPGLTGKLPKSKAVPKPKRQIRQPTVKSGLGETSRQSTDKSEIADKCDPSPQKSYNNIIPGMKALNRLKANAAAASTRSSPRLTTRKAESPACARSITQSVSCQTSPHLIKM